MIDSHLPKLEAIAKQGATVVVKLDGPRARNDANLYTVMINGGNLGKEDYFRKDGNDLDRLIRDAISFYDLNGVNKK